MDRKSFLASVLAVLVAPFVAWRDRRRDAAYSIWVPDEQGQFVEMRPTVIDTWQIDGLRAGDRYNIRWSGDSQPVITRL